jgi:hypothetical protein
MRNVVFYLLLAYLMLLSGLAHSSIRIHSHTFEPAPITVGDVIHLRLLIEADADRRIELDSLDVSQLEHVEADAPELNRLKSQTEGKAFYEAIYPLRAFAPGRHVLPAITVRYVGGGSIRTPAYFFEVQPVKPPHTKELQDIKPPLAPPQSLGIYILGGLLFVVLLVASIFLYFRKRNRTPPPAPIQVPLERLPHEIAGEQLRRIETQNLVAQGQMKTYHTEISQVIRQYLAARFQLPALEMTTDELLDRLATENIHEANFDLLRNFLLNCNLVKFAKYTPSQSEAVERMTEARRIIEAMQA